MMMLDSHGLPNGQAPVTTGSVLAAGYGMLGAHLAWGFQLLMCYWLVQPVCGEVANAWLHVASAVALVVAVGAFLTAFWTWRRSGVSFGWGLDGTNGWLSFAAFFGMASGILLITGIIAAWIMIVALEPCAQFLA